MPRYMSATSVIFRELRFWGQAVLVCSLPLAAIYFFAGHLGLSNPFENVDPSTPHASPGRAQIGFILMIIIFYIMRFTDRVAYGLAEILLALAGFGFFYAKLANNYSPDAFLLTTGGLIYLGVRGIDNIVTGAKRHYANPATDPRWFW